MLRVKTVVIKVVLGLTIVIGLTGMTGLQAFAESLTYDCRRGPDQVTVELVFSRHDFNRDRTRFDEKTFLNRSGRWMGDFFCFSKKYCTTQPVNAGQESGRIRVEGKEFGCKRTYPSSETYENWD
jgi:hypothetical protein